MIKLDKTHSIILAGLIAGCASPEGAGDMPDMGLGTQGADAEGGAIQLVVLGNGVSAEAVAAATGGDVVHSLPEVGLAYIQGGSNVAKQPGVLATGGQSHYRLPEVVAEHEATAPTGNDVLLHLGLLWGVERVHAPEAWATTSGSHDTTVAVIDTGVASNHPDLAPNMVDAQCYNTSSVFFGGSCSTYPDWPGDGGWHGTHVAGTVAAAFDHGLAVGVGPNLGLASYHVFEPFDTGEETVFVAFDAPIFSAIIDAANKGYDVINMSLGGALVFPYGKENAATWMAWNRVVNYATNKGTIIVAAAGNDSYDSNGPVAFIPGDLPNVVNVSATGIGPEPRYTEDSYDRLSFFSNYGASQELSAPGGDCGSDGGCFPTSPTWFEHLILSTMVTPDPGCAATASCPTGYGWAAGTSMASPHVAGVAGLLRDAEPGLNPHQVKSRLTQTAESLGDFQAFGHGMVDAAAALNP